MDAAGEGTVTPRLEDKVLEDEIPEGKIGEPGKLTTDTGTGDACTVDGFVAELDRTEAVEG